MLFTVATGLLCGIALGFVLQRGRYCMVSAYRDVYLTKDNRMFIATFIAIAVQSIGIYALYAGGVIELAQVPFTWVTAIVGGLVFGFGIVLAGGCATGTWYRAGEGLVGSWIALIAYMLGSAMTRHGMLKPVNDTLSKPRTEDVFIYETLNVTPWVLVSVLSIIVVFVVWRHFKQPAIRVPSLKARKSGIAHLLFEKRWHPFVTALLVGIIAIIAWPLSEATGRMYGLGITGPSGNLLKYLVTGDAKLLDWGVFLIIGIAAGSYIAARGSGEFRWRIPDFKTIRNNFVGGILMGFGAGIAGGCTIGNGLVNTSLFTWQGWVATPFIIAGTWLATWLFMVRPRKIRAAVNAKVLPSNG